MSNSAKGLAHPTNRSNLFDLIWIQALGISLLGISGLVIGPAVMARPSIGVLTGEGSVAQLRADGIRYQEMGFMTLAEQAYRQALALEDRANLLPPERDADVPFNLGLIYLQQGQLSQARQMFQRAYDASPNNFQIIYQLGTVELRLGNQDAARRHLTRLEHASKNNPEMKEHIGSLIALLDPPARLDNHSFTDGNTPALSPGATNPPLSPAAASLLSPDQQRSFTPAGGGPGSIPLPDSSLQRLRNRRD